MEAVRADHFEQLVVVAIVDVNADEYRTSALIQGPLQHGRDFLPGISKCVRRATCVNLPLGPRLCLYLCVHYFAVGVLGPTPR
jgi:hypothetical protein